MDDTNRIQIAVIIGSTRPNRRGPAVAEWVASAPPDGAELRVIDLAALELPLLDEPRAAAFGEYEGPATRRFSRLIAPFDAYVLVTPEYNHSTSGALKNALDHLYAEWRDKPVAFVGYGLEGGTRAVEHLRGICAELGMAGVGPQVSLDLGEDFAAGGATCAPRESRREALARTLGTLVRWAAALRSARPPADPPDAGSENAPPDGSTRPALEWPGARPPAEDAVRELVAAIQAALDEGDAERYDARFAADLIWGGPFGATVAGIDDLLAIHRRLMKKGAAGDSRYEVVQVRAPAPGVAVAHVRRRALGEEDGFSEMALYVLVERGGRWWLAAGQNTPLVDTAPRVED
jgi:uncharacterized protein (TIGR02246 family)